MTNYSHPLVLNKNRILAALPSNEYNVFAHNIEHLNLSYGKVLYDFGDEIRYVYFLNSGMGSLLSVTEDGAIIEVGMVGNEGMLGMPIIMGMQIMPYRVTMQVAGTAMRVRAGLVKQVFDQNGVLYRLLLRYTYTLLAQITQSALCNHFHTVEERLCRWLLTTRDRTKFDKFRLTHEMLSQMLGARRQGVTEVANTLRKAGLINYVRGEITLLNLSGLRDRSCECYAVVREAHSQAQVA
jgi:CRP-like cAMP-binding protein